MNIKVSILYDTYGRNGVYEFPNKESLYKTLNTGPLRKKVPPRFLLKLSKDGLVTDVRDNAIGTWYELKYSEPKNPKGGLVFSI